MGLFGTKVIEPTHEQRVAAATDKRTEALGAFHSAAVDLEDAATELESVVEVAQTEVEKLDALAERASADAAANRAVATKIRALVEA